MIQNENQKEPLRVRPDAAHWVSRRVLTRDSVTPVPHTPRHFALGLLLEDAELLRTVARAIATGRGLIAVAPDDSEHTVVTNWAEWRMPGETPAVEGPVVEAIAHIADCKALIDSIVEQARSIPKADRASANWIVPPLSLRGCTIDAFEIVDTNDSPPMPIVARNCWFYGSINIRQSTFHESVSLYNCLFDASVSVDRGRVNNGLRVERCHFRGPVAMIDATLNPRFDCTECQFAENISLRHMIVRECSLRQNTYGGKLVLGPFPRLEGTPLDLSGSVFVTGLEYEDDATPDMPIDIAGSYVSQNALIRGDLRAIDTRGVTVVKIRNGLKEALLAEASNDWERLECKAENSRRRKGWRYVRAMGEIDLFTRISVLGLVGVPALAFIWPLFRSLSTTANQVLAATVSQQIEAIKAASESSVLDGDPSQTAVARLEEANIILIDWVQQWQYLPASLFLIFMASILVLAATILYQVHCPAIIKEQSESEFIDSERDKFPSTEEGQLDGVRQAVAALREHAERFVDSHPCLVSHRGRVVWIPADDQLYVLAQSEVKRPTNSEAATGHFTSYERSRIAIEAGAAAKYDAASQEKSDWAFYCFTLYFVAGTFTVIVLGVQIVAVFNAVGLWERLAR